MNFINLSSQQAPNDVDWAGLVNSGVQGVLIRLGHGIIRDPCASGHIAKAKQYGLYWHGYHTYEGVVNEPQFTIKNATELGLSTSQYYFVDLTKSSDPFNDYYALHATWLSQGYSTGLLISNDDYLSKFTDSEVTASGTLRWLISDTEPANYDVWQYSSEGMVGTSSAKVGLNFAKTDKLKYNLNTTLTGADINKDPYNPQTPVGGAYIGWGYDTTGLGGGKTIGYSTNGENFYALIGPNGLVVRKSDGNRIYGTIADQIDSAISANVIPAKSAADSAVAYANDAIKKSRVNSQAIDDINSAVSDAVSDAAVARSDGLRAWNAAQSNVNLIDLNYASASAAISSARTEAIAAADEAKSSASVAQAGVVAVKSDVAAVQADVTATRSDVAVAKSDIADTKTTLEQTASGLNSKISGVETSLADTTSALSDAKTALTSDVADAKKLANTAQATADNAVKSASSVADDLTAVASQAKANTNGITKVTSDVGLLQTTVANNTGDISTIQETAKQIQQSVSDNAGNITVAKQTADSAVAVASDAKSNATVAIQTASQASITAQNASGQAASAVITANGAMTTASDAKSNATVAVQTASGASLTATNANSDATVAKQTASEAKVQASNAESDFAQLSIRANKIEANVADNSGAIASVQQTANGLTTTVGNVDNRVKKIEDNTNWTTKTGTLDMDTLTTTQNIYYRDTNLKNADGEAGWAYIQVVSTGERVTQTVWHDRSSIQHTRTGAIDGSTYDWDAWNQSATNSQVAEVKQTVDGITTTVSNIQGDVSQLKVSASSASVALSDAAGNISNLQATAKSFSAALSDTNSNVASVTATASELETKYADAANDISQIKTDAKGMTQTISNAQGDIAKLKTRADGFDAEFATANGNISKLQTDATGTTQTLANTKSDVAVLQSRADGLDTKYANAAGDINTLKANASGISQTLTNSQGDISTLKSTVSGVQTTLTDAQGNISTLQSDVSGLKKTTSDNAGNISTLQATAKTLTSQMSGAQGDISTLKQTASDFSSKVSGMETSLSDANSKINGITSNGGGRNLLQGTGTASGDVAGGNGTFAQGAFNGYDAVKTNGCWSEHYLDLKSALGRTNAKAGDWYTISVYVKADKQIDTGSLDVYRALGNVDANTNDGHLDPILMPNKPITTQWQQYSWSFQINNVSLQRQNTRVEYNFDTGDNWIYWAGWMLENGTVSHDWSPAPEDTDAKITANTTAIEQNKQAIALKADQTTVDKTNGTVQQLQSQLQVQAGQIASKVSSSDLDAKGYATQTYTQTQIKQTSDSWNANLASVKDGLTQSYTNLSATVNGLTTTVGNVDDRVKKIEDNTNWTTKTGVLDMNTLTTTQNIYYRDTNLKNADGETGWAYIQVVSTGERVTQTVWNDRSSIQHTRTGAIDGSTYDWDAWNQSATNAQVTAIKQTVDGIQTQVYNSDGSSKITQLSNLIATKVSSDDFNNLSKSVNLQTLDSADINNMKTNGHYFVHNLANNPIGGWVYVDVTGNGNDRIRQDVYQDSGIGHKYRRLFGTYWTNWEEGATYTEINQLQDAINLRVTKGDLISQINLQAGTALIQSNKLVLDAGTTVITGEAFIPSAAISSISADKVTIGSSSLYNSDGTLNLVNSKDGTTSKITVTQGNVDFDGIEKNASVIHFASDNNTNAFTITPVGATVTPTLFFERFDQTPGHWLGFTRNETEHEGVMFHTWDDDGERFFVDCHARFDKNLRTLGTLSQGSWDGTTAKPEAGVLTIKNGNTIWSGSNFLAIGDNLSNSYTNVMAKSFSQQSTLSSKTNIEEVDPKDALDLVNRTDIRSYQYTSDVEQGKTKRYTSLILDDVHDVSQYYAPDEFANEERTGRDDGSAVGYLFLAVKELTRRIKNLEEKLNG
ncbi:tail fiber [Lactobacillus phage JNU_P1]|nr:tail fiber [Lactobacillus phage JNU_P1]